MKTSNVFVVVLSALCIFSCREESNPNPRIFVKNTMDSDRSFETVSIDLASFNITDSIGNLVIRDVATQAEIVSQ
ncbi:MAG: hypothetical protein KJO73_00140, partial [Croceitalea sp.]|nr:hypothetical protein [Croceitalea sp.]